MRVMLATICRGRSEHLAAQAHAVSRMEPAPHRYVVVSMDPEPPVVPGAAVVHLPVAEGEPLPLAAARNRALQAADHADLVVMLDVDCLPAADLVRVFADAAKRTAGTSLLAGPVGRLPEGALADEGVFTAAKRDAQSGPRPVPRPGALVEESRYELFWSLAFAVTPAVHRAIGGFDEGYVGYGAEDTDYAFRARAAGVGLTWVGGAWSFHQHHPVSDPPVEHLEDIVRNARRFHERWSRWPMERWLAGFADRGLVEWSDDELRINDLIGTG